MLIYGWGVEVPEHVVDGMMIGPSRIWLYRLCGRFSTCRPPVLVLSWGVEVPEHMVGDTMTGPSRV